MFGHPWIRVIHCSQELSMLFMRCGLTGIHPCGISTLDFLSCRKLCRWPVMRLVYLSSQLDLQHLSRFYDVKWILKVESSPLYPHPICAGRTNKKVIILLCSG